MLNIISLIPARSGSKRLKNKNIRKINNKPLIYYSIKASLGTKKINQTFVSTDSPNIQNLSIKYGASAPFLRPKIFAKDQSSDFDVINHFLKYYRDNYKKKIDFLIYLRPTVPIRSNNIITKSIHKLQENIDCTSLRTINFINDQVHPYWVFKIDKGILLPFMKAFNQTKYFQRQMLPPAYRCTGSVDIINLNHYKVNSKNIYGKKILPLHDQNVFIDIDTNLDLENLNTLVTKKNISFF